MTKSELRAYVLAHRDNTEAFQALADHIYAHPHPEWHQPEDTERISELFPNLKTEDKT